MMMMEKHPQPFSDERDLLTKNVVRVVPKKLIKIVYRI